MIRFIFILLLDVEPICSLMFLYNMNDFNFIHDYFTEEKIASFFFIIIGSISIVLAFIFLFIIQYSFFKGLAIPFLFIGCIQVLLGTITVLRAPKDMIRVEQQLNQEPQKIITEELSRMEKIQKNFRIYKWIEITLLILGLILFCLFYKSAQSFWKGLGMGLIIQAGTLLTLDLIAEKRADTYVARLVEKTVN